MKPSSLALALVLVVFASAALAAGRSGTNGGYSVEAGFVACDNDGVTVTYQDPDRDGDYETATVSDIDCPGRHTTKVTILDLEPGVRTLALGRRTTSGSLGIVIFSNVLLRSEIEDADRVQVVISRSD